jgi:hypothetical protein
VVAGHKAESIGRFAEEHHCSRVLIDQSAKSGLLSVFGLGSVASQVRQLMDAQAHATGSSPGASSPT